MKKSIILVVVIVIIGLIIWGVTRDKGESVVTPGTETASSTPIIPVSETTKVSDKLSEYKNEELGFSVKYPSVWELTPGETGINLVVPTGKPETNTIGKLESKVMVVSGKCAFPPVTTIKERTTLKSGDLNFNMISMSNSVQGRSYFDRMYSLQRGDSICYIFSFSSITLSPASKGFKGSEATQMTNNNKALVDAADASFTSMVKSFAYVVGAAGKSETEVVPVKK